jgi:hypothetical protein
LKRVDATQHHDAVFQSMLQKVCCQLELFNLFKRHICICDAHMEGNVCCW